MVRVWYVSGTCVVRVLHVWYMCGRCVVLYVWFYLMTWFIMSLLSCVEGATAIVTVGGSGITLDDFWKVAKQCLVGEKVNEIPAECRYRVRQKNCTLWFIKF